MIFLIIKSTCKSFSIAGGAWEASRWSHGISYAGSSDTHIPRYSLISWLAVLDRMDTKCRMPKWTSVSYFTSTAIPGPGSHDHLFFSYSYAGAIWSSILSKILTPWPPGDSHFKLNWATSHR